MKHLGKFVQKRMHNGKEEYALIDINKPSKVFKWFGEKKPSDAQILKELHAVEYFKHSTEEVKEAPATFDRWL